MPVGLILLVAVAILIYLGVLHRVLDRMKLDDRSALAIIALMLLGSFIDLPLSPGRVFVNVGGAVVPIGVSVYLIVTADESAERLRSVVAAVAVGILVFAIGRLMPSEPGQYTVVDPGLAYGLAGGIVGYAVGRSRRASFIAGTTGVVLADIAVAAGNAATGLPTVLRLGGAGVVDTVVIAGVVAVGLAETIGELRERGSRAGSGEPGGDQS